jgi:phosphate transport system substrate-binding protein
MKKAMVLGATAVMASSILGCAKKPQESELLKIDGSSTVFPITEAVAEEFQKSNPNTRITVGISGTGGGFKKFGTGEIDIADASRPIKPSEVEQCKQNGIEYIELPVAYDGLAVVIHPQNTWARSITVAELKKLWSPQAQGKVTRWSDVRSDWPNEEIHLFGPGVDSGTYDYFTAAIVGTEHSSRGDFTSSEDDNVLVQGISTDKYALGFFGLAYYQENRDKLKLLPVDDENDGNGKGPVAPSFETVANGTYQPLSRPIFIYVSTKSLDRPQVANFVKFYLAHAAGLVKEVGYIPLSQQAYSLAQNRVDKQMTGSIFGGKGSQIGVLIEDLLQKTGQ